MVTIKDDANKPKVFRMYLSNYAGSVALMCATEGSGTLAWTLGTFVETAGKLKFVRTGGLPSTDFELEGGNLGNLLRTV